METLFTRKSAPAKKTVSKFKFGIPSFDRFLSGGLYQGTITLMFEDSQSKHYYSFIRCFLGEGAQAKDQLFVYSNLLTTNLIPPVGKMPKESTSKMRIAWRYAKQSQSEPESSVYDLSKSLNYTYMSSNPRPSSLYTQIYEDISSSLSGIDDTKPRRIYIRLNLSQWENKELNIFWISLRSLLRSLNAVCLISINTSFGNDMSTLICENNADFVLAVEDFEEKNPFVGFNAMLKLRKNVRLMTLGNYEISNYVLGVIRDNKFLSVENLSLPPADSMSGSKAIDY